MSDAEAATAEAEGVDDAGGDRSARAALLSVDDGAGGSIGAAEDGRLDDWGGHGGGSGFHEGRSLSPAEALALVSESVTSSAGVGAVGAGSTAAAAGGSSPPARAGPPGSATGEGASSERGHGADDDDDLAGWGEHAGTADDARVSGVLRGGRGRGSAAGASGDVKEGSTAGGAGSSSPTGSTSAARGVGHGGVNGVEVGRGAGGAAGTNARAMVNNGEAPAAGGKEKRGASTGVAPRGKKPTPSTHPPKAGAGKPPVPKKKKKTPKGGNLKDAPPGESGVEKKKRLAHLRDVRDKINGDGARAASEKMRAYLENKRRKKEEAMARKYGRLPMKRSEVGSNATGVEEAAAAAVVAGFRNPSPNSSALVAALSAARGGDAGGRGRAAPSGRRAAAGDSNREGGGVSLPSIPGAARRGGGPHPQQRRNVDGIVRDLRGNGPAAARPRYSPSPSLSSLGSPRRSVGQGARAAPRGGAKSFAGMAEDYERAALRAVRRREETVATLYRAASAMVDGGPGARGDLASLPGARAAAARDIAGMWEACRRATVEAVEAVVAWRKNNGSGAPFVWNGEEYLSRVGRDLLFLRSVPGAMNAIGFAPGEPLDPFFNPAVDTVGGRGSEVTMRARMAARMWETEMRSAAESAALNNAADQPSPGRAHADRRHVAVAGGMAQTSPTGAFGKPARGDVLRPGGSLVTPRGPKHLAARDGWGVDAIEPHPHPPGPQHTHTRHHPHPPNRPPPIHLDPADGHSGTTPKRMGGLPSWLAGRLAQESSAAAAAAADTAGAVAVDDGMNALEPLAPPPAHAGGGPTSDRRALSGLESPPGRAGRWSGTTRNRHSAESSALSPGAFRGGMSRGSGEGVSRESSRGLGAIRYAESPFIPSPSALKARQARGGRGGDRAPKGEGVGSDCLAPSGVAFLDGIPAHGVPSSERLPSSPGYEPPRLDDDEETEEDGHHGDAGDFPSPAPSAAAAYIGRFHLTSPAALGTPAGTPAVGQHGDPKHRPVALPSLSDDDDEGEDGGEDSDSEADESFGEFGDLPDFNPRSAVSPGGYAYTAGGGRWDPDAAVDMPVDWGRMRSAAVVPPSPRSDLLRLEEETRAAVRIQAGARGHLVRVRRERRRARENAAAVRIQAVHRGRAVRSRLANEPPRAQPRLSRGAHHLSVSPEPYESSAAGPEPIALEATFANYITTGGGASASRGGTAETDDVCMNADDDFGFDGEQAAATALLAAAANGGHAAMGSVRRMQELAARSLLGDTSGAVADLSTEDTLRMAAASLSESLRTAAAEWDARERDRETSPIADEGAWEVGHEMINGNQGRDEVEHHSAEVEGDTIAAAHATLLSTASPPRLSTAEEGVDDVDNAVDDILADVADGVPELETVHDVDPEAALKPDADPGGEVREEPEIEPEPEEQLQPEIEADSDPNPDPEPEREPKLEPEPFSVYVEGESIGDADDDAEGALDTRVNEDEGVGKGVI